jgi:predicted TIM-barrel fold metal-dependent hydrolase
MLPNCPVIDSHHHLGRRAGPDGPREFTGDDLVRQMDRHGVTHSIALHFVSVLRTPDDFRRANAYVAEQVLRHPGRLTGGVVVNPLIGDLALREITMYHSQGFRAVKLHPIFHGHYHVDGGAVDEVARLAGDLGLPVVIHSDFLSPVCSPYEIVRLARRFPQTTFVMLHLGIQSEMCKLAPDVVADTENVMLDTSQTPDFPHTVYVNPVRRLGSNRLMFGSDGPDCDPSLNLRKMEIAIEEHGLRLDEAIAVLFTNARRVFRLDTLEVD